MRLHPLEDGLGGITVPVRVIVPEHEHMTT